MKTGAGDVAQEPYVHYPVPQRWKSKSRVGINSHGTGKTYGTVGNPQHCDWKGLKH